MACKSVDLTHPEGILLARADTAAFRAQDYPDERQQGAERAGAPSGDGSHERDREDGKIKPL